MSDKLLGRSEQVNAGWNPGSGREHKAWRGAERNPRTTIVKTPERAKRAIAQTLRFTRHKRLSPTSWALPFLLEQSWGFAPLHPRLYAIAALRGLSANSSPTCSEVPKACRTLGRALKIRALQTR